MSTALVVIRWAFVVILIGLAVFVPTAVAVDLEWIGPANAPWGTAANWNPANVPDVAGEAAVFPAAFALTANLNISPTIDRLDFNAPGGTLNLGGQTLMLSGSGLTNLGTVRSNTATATINGAILNQAAAPLGLIVNQSTSLTLSGPTVTNNGRILVNHVGNFDSSLTFSGNVLLTGSGELLLNGDTGNDIIASSGGTLTQAAGHTIRGRGAITAALTNNGTVEGDSGGFGLELNTNPKTNTGEWRAIAGGILRISGITVDNAGGTIKADGGSVLVGGGAIINGGTLSGSSIVSGISACTLNGVTIAAGAQYDVNQSTQTTMNGPTITNDGTIRVNHVGNFDSSLVFASDVALVGNGEIFINGDTLNDFIDTAGSFTLTQPVGHTIRGEGAVRATLTNAGDIIADEATHVLDLNTHDKSNTGTLTTINGGILRVSGITLDNASGDIVAADGPVQFGANTTVNNGVLSGPSVISGIGNCTLNGVTIASNTQYDVNQSTQTTMNGPTITNNGTIRVNHVGNFDSSLVFASDVALVGNGEIFVNGDTVNDFIDTAVAFTLTQPMGHTIRGEGAVRAALVNNGDVVADEMDHILELNTHAKTNNGMLTTANGGILRVSGIPLDNTAGDIVAAAGPVQFSGATTISGGVLSGPSVISGIGNCTLNSITIAANTQYDVNQGTITTMNGPTITNNGTIRVNHVGNFDAGLLFFSDVTLVGDGALFINGDNLFDFIDTGVDATLTNSAQHTIRGDGAIRADLINAGDIVADEAGQVLELNSKNKINSGTARGSGGGILRVSGITLDNSAGDIVADGGPVHFINATIAGGVLSGPSLISGTGNCTLNGVAIAAGTQYDVNQGTTTTVTGGLTNDGTVRVNHIGGFDADIIFDGSQTLGGDGDLFINGDNVNDRLSLTAGSTLTNAVSHTIRGGGAINGAVTNDGVVLADDPTLLVITPAAPGFANNGLLRVSGTGGMTINSAALFSNALHVIVDAARKLTVNGNYLQTFGDTTAHGELEVNTGALQLQAGILRGNGLVDADVQNTGGAVNPGGTTGSLDVEGSYTQAAGGTLKVQLGGLTQGVSYDLLAVTGAATLGGTLEVALANGFFPVVGNTFTILTAGSISGTFANVISSQPCFTASVSYTANSVIVTITGINPGACPAQIMAANPPTDNPFVADLQPYLDVLDTGSGAVLTEGIGGVGTPAENSIVYSPISVTFTNSPTAAITPANVGVTCSGGVCPSVTAVSGAGVGPYLLTLSGPIPPGQCTTLEFTAGVDADVTLNYQSLPGDVNMNGVTSSTDVQAMVAALSNGQATMPANLPRYDINRNGVASSTDVLRLLQLLNGLLSPQLFLNVSVAPCP